MVGTLPQALFTGVWTKDPATPIDERICEDFEAISSEREWFDFARRYGCPCRPSDYAVRALSVDDYEAVKSVLHTAMRLREIMTRDGDADVFDLMRCGILIKTVEKGSQLYALMTLSVPCGVYAGVLARLLASEFDERPWPYRFPESGKHEDPITDVLPWDSRIEVFSEHGRLSFRFIVTGVDGDTVPDSDAVKSVAAKALDKLMSAHLKGVETSARNGGVPYQYTFLGVSALWLAYGNKFSHVRVAVCAACGRPIMVSGERGKKRKYCDDVCRKWAHKNPGKTRTR